MAEKAAGEGPHPALSLCASYNGDDPELLARLVPLVDALEVTPDAMARFDGCSTRLRADVVQQLKDVSGDLNLVAHGVGLSIGSFDRWQDQYLQLMDETFEHFDLAWHSEHLGYAVVAGEQLGTMLPVPRTEEALDLVCRRVDVIQKRYGVPFLLENVIALLPEPEGLYSPASFLNEITSSTACGLLLDVYNLKCDEYNQGLDTAAFLQELDYEPVIELHVAGGPRQDGFQLDVHSRHTDESTLSLAIEIVQRAPRLRALTFEYLRAAVSTLGHDAICNELVRLRGAIS